MNAKDAFFVYDAKEVPRKNAQPAMLCCQHTPHTMPSSRQRYVRLPSADAATTGIPAARAPPVSVNLHHACFARRFRLFRDSKRRPFRVCSLIAIIALRHVTLRFDAKRAENVIEVMPIRLPVIMPPAERRRAAAAMAKNYAHAVATSRLFSRTMFDFRLRR